MATAMVRATVFLLLLIFWPQTSQAKEIPKPTVEDQQQQQTKETKDLKVASTSYVYSKNRKHGFDDLPRFHGTHSGLNFPPRSFNFPTKYRVGRFGGVGSGIGGFGLGLNRKSFVSHLDGDDIGGSLGLNRYGPSTFELESHDESEDLLGHDKHHHHHHHHHHHEPQHEEKHQEKGEKFAEEHESSGDKESSKGYKVAEEYDKGAKSKKQKGEESGEFNEEAGAKKSHEEQEKAYAEKEESAKAAKGEHFAHSEGHKKGHKTTGYHNVYHKDEYKKDTTFYDDEHVDAQQEQYSEEDEKHSSSEAEHKKAEHVDAAYEQADKAQKGFFTNGHQYGVAQAHDREEAVKEHHENERESHKEEKHKSANEEAESSHSHH